MRKAKVAALIIGGVSTCLFGGTFGVIATSPIVKSVTPDNDVKNIYDVESEELANVAAVTSIRTTPRITTSKYTVSYGTTTTIDTKSLSSFKKSSSVDVSLKGSMAKPNYKDDIKNIVTTKVYAPVVTSTATTTLSYVLQTTTTSPTTTTLATTTTVATEAPTEASTTSTTVVTMPVTEAPTEAPTEALTEAPTELPTESVETVTPVLPDKSVDSLPITDEEYIILCNAVANEAGCNWISTYDKALVVEVIMNRVESNLYPNTILGVLTQPNQFTDYYKYVYLGDFSGYVTQDVKDAVNLYFSEPESFAHGYFGFYGDGTRNYFY